jgi:hypothetical protein
MSKRNENIYSAFNAGRKKKNNEYVYPTIEDWLSHESELSNIPLMHSDSLKVQTDKFKNLYNKYITKLRNEINKKYE